MIITSGSYRPIVQNDTLMSSTTPFSKDITAAVTGGGLETYTNSEVTGNFSIEAIDKILVSLPTTPTPKWMADNYSPDVITKMLKRVRTWTGNTTTATSIILDNPVSSTDNMTSEASMTLMEKIDNLASVTNNMTSEASIKLLENIDNLASVTGDMTSEASVLLTTDNLTSEASMTLLENLNNLASVTGNVTSEESMKLLENLDYLSTVTPLELTYNSTSEAPSRLLDNLTSEMPKWLLGRNESDIPTKEVMNDTTPYYFKFRHEPWIYPLLAIVAFNILAIIIFDVYILYKSCGSKRHLVMGQILLFALFLGSLLGLLYVPQPHWVFCGITRAGVGLIYATIFAVLFMKCLFLLNYHRGNYISAAIQVLFLFFIVAIEVAIVTQWLVYEPPSTISLSETDHLENVCSKTPLEKIEYLSYVMFLLLLVIIIAIRTRNLRENNWEARYVGVTIGICVIIWVAWISVSLVFNRRYEAPAEAFGLVCTCSVVIIIIFIPKAVNLTSELENNQNGSSGSRSVLNTPSFLHLQPHAVIPTGGQDTIVKQTSLNADFCRGYTSSMWRYELYPRSQEMEPPVSDSQSLKKSNYSSNSRLC